MNQDKKETLEYEKLMTEFITQRLSLEEIQFVEVTFKKVKTEERLPTDELEYLGVFDPNLYD